MTKYEYDTVGMVGLMPHDKLNGYGQQGWELVGFSRTVVDTENFVRYDTIYIFKRPIKC